MEARWGVSGCAKVDEYAAAASPWLELLTDFESSQRLRPDCGQKRSCRELSNPEADVQFFGPVCKLRPFYSWLSRNSNLTKSRTMPALLAVDYWGYSGVDSFRALDNPINAKLTLSHSSVLSVPGRSAAIRASRNLIIASTTSPLSPA